MANTAVLWLQTICQSIFLIQNCHKGINHLSLITMINALKKDKKNIKFAPVHRLQSKSGYVNYSLTEVEAFLCISITDYQLLISCLCYSEL